MNFSLYHLLEKTVMKYPHRPLFHITPTIFVSYDKFMEDVKGFRSILHKNNVKVGDNVILFGNNSTRWASLAYAVWAAGAVLVPTYGKQRVDIKKHMIRETEPKIIFNSGDILYEKNELNHETVEFDNRYVRMLNEPDVKQSDVATILYTSGTTGLPKGVVLTHGNIISNMESIDRTINNYGKSANAIYATLVDCDDKYVSFLPWSHCYGLNCELNFLIWKGASTHINTDLTKLRNNFVEYNPTILCGVPKLFHEIHKKINIYDKFPTFVKNIVKKKTFGKNLRFATVGGATTSVELLQFYQRMGVQLVQGYGITECSPMISLNNIFINKIGSVGRILDCNRVRIVGGEIWVNGKNVSNGYYSPINKNSSTTSHSLLCTDPDNRKLQNIDDDTFCWLCTHTQPEDRCEIWFRTGDSGYFDKDGYLYITGRIKESYKLSNGKFVNPDELEQTILTHIPEIKQIMIYAKDGDEFNSAVVVTDSKLNENDIIQKISNLNIDKYKIPHNILITNDAFTIDNDLVTPKQSLKRNNILKYFAIK